MYIHVKVSIITCTLYLISNEWYQKEHKHLSHVHQLEHHPSLKKWVLNIMFITVSHKPYHSPLLIHTRTCTPVCGYLYCWVIDLRVHAHETPFLVLVEGTTSYEWSMPWVWHHIPQKMQCTCTLGWFNTHKHKLVYMYIHLLINRGVDVFARFYSHQLH